MRLATFVLFLEFGMALGADVPPAFLNEKNAWSFDIELTAYLPRYSSVQPLRISFCSENTLIEPWAMTDTDCSLTMPTKYLQSLAKYFYTHKAFHNPSLYYMKCVETPKHPAPPLPNIESRQKEKLPAARVDVSLAVIEEKNQEFKFYCIATLPWDRELIPFLDGAIKQIKGTGCEEPLRWLRDGCALHKAPPTPWVSWDSDKDKQLLGHHLSQIPMGGFEVTDTPFEVVLKTFEGRFQDYRKTHPDAARELPKTLFTVRASRALLQQKVEGIHLAPTGNLWDGIHFLTYCLDGLAVADLPHGGSTDVSLPIENGHLVVRNGAFSMQDIKDFAALASKLKDAKDGVSQYLLDRPDQVFRKELLEYQSSGSNTGLLRGCVLRELNRTAYEAAFYDPQRFAGVKLSPATLALLKKHPQGQALIRLNRMLLEDAYPMEISKHVREK